MMIHSHLREIADGKAAHVHMHLRALAINQICQRRGSLLLLLLLLLLHLAVNRFCLRPVADGDIQNSIKGLPAALDTAHKALAENRIIIISTTLCSSPPPPLLYISMCYLDPWG